MWVHSSEHAWKFYEKNGFDVVGELDIHLDERAPRLPDGELGKAWGHYVCRYMKRVPKSVEA